MKSTKQLMADHEIIMRALNVLQAMVHEMEHGKDVNAEDIRSLLSFLREFADGCHHVKEEAILFPALMQAGMSVESGPLRVMLYEHEKVRGLSSAIEDAFERHTREDFIRYSKRYIELLSDHVEKENYVLFDMVERTLTLDGDNNVAEAFDRFETTTVGTQTHARLHRQIEKLVSKYLFAAA